MEKLSANNPSPLAILKATYQKIGTAKSPALCGNLVSFSNVGLNHLFYKNSVPRPRKESHRRFALLRYAKEILEGRQATVAYREKLIGNSIVHFGAFSAFIDRQKIKVVVSRIDDGKKQFLSIMND